MAPVRDQQREQSTLLRTADGEELAVRLDLDRSEDLDAHPTPSKLIDGSPTSHTPGLQFCNIAGVLQNCSRTVPWISQPATGRPLQPKGTP